MGKHKKIRPIQLPSEADLHWFAGLMEGEGWFITTVYHHRKVKYRYARIGVNMTDRDIIERVGMLLGNKAVQEKPSNPKNGSRLMQYRCSTTGAGAVQWMRLLYPLMGIRRKKQINTCFSKLDLDLL